MRQSYRKGFTLIEILVVVAIIGILVSIMTFNFSKARGDSRNKTVRTSLSEVQLALAVYKSQNGQYPAVPAVGLPCAQSASNPHYSDSTLCAATPYILSLTPDFIAVLPSHTMSGNSSCKFVYRVASDHSYYKLTAENCFAGAVSAATGIQTDDEFARCPSSCGTCNGSAYAAYKITSNFYQSLAVYSSGGECL